MANNITDSLLIVCKLLEKHGVRYLLEGGTAVALNGYFRLSVNDDGELTEKPDIDIWYYPTYENYFKLISLIEELGYDVTEFREEETPDPRSSFFKLKFDDFSLDLLPEIKAPVKFTAAYKRKEVFEMQEATIYVLNYKDLILDKQALGRKKDQEDVKQLEKIRGGNSPEK